MKIQSTGYWIFFCNPARWNIDDFLNSDPKSTTYLITEGHKNMFRLGQKGVIRVAKDKRQNRKRLLSSGIYAIVEITGLPHLRGIGDLEFWNEPKPIISDRHCVDLRIVKNLIDKPILMNYLKSYPERYDKSLINGGYGWNSSFPLSSMSFEAINTLLEKLLR
jgi:hypothetical protein